jgi:hypothetical protein
MEGLLDFLKTNQAIAFITALMIFFVTMLLVVRRVIGFSVTLLLFIFSILAGLVIVHYDTFPACFRDAYSSNEKEPTKQFDMQILKAMKDLQTEVDNGKETLHLVLNQVQEVFQELEGQKQKLETFIEETQEHFKNEVEEVK